MALRSFADKPTENFWHGTRVSAFEGLERAAMRKLTTLNAAISLDSLASVPGNRLELLKGDRRGQHSTSINDRWRLCFKWQDGDAYDVAITKHYT